MNRFSPPLLALGLALSLWLFAVVMIVDRPNLAQAEDPPADMPAKKDLVPIEKTNCVKCHLKAGRDLTEAVEVFSHSAHDYAGLSCNDCHGGNTEVDTKAHSDEFGFIGTKMTAHLKKCRECHDTQFASLSKGKHFWDHDKQLNTKMPICVDCHGNHDVGNVPAEFSLSAVCLDCHKDFKEKYPSFAALTEENDLLWNELRGYRSKRPRGPEWMSEDLKTLTAALRALNAEVMHSVAGVSDKQVEELKGKSTELRKKLKEASESKTTK